MEPTTWLIVKFVNGRPEIVSKLYDDRGEMETDYERAKTLEPGERFRVYELAAIF